jgi:hypothetical protein
VEYDCFAQVRSILVRECSPKMSLSYMFVVVHEEHNSLSGCTPLLDMLDEVLAEENQRACEILLLCDEVSMLLLVRGPGVDVLILP